MLVRPKRTLTCLLAGGMVLFQATPMADADQVWEKVQAAKLKVSGASVRGQVGQVHRIIEEPIQSEN